MSAESQEERAPPAARLPWKRWLPGFVLLVGVGIIALRAGEAGRFFKLLLQVDPGWLVVATLFQCGTYVCDALTWHRVLHRLGSPQSLRELLPLAFAKLFIDQAVPSGGASGSLFVLYVLAQRRIERPRRMAAVLIGVVTNNVAFALMAAVSVVLLLWKGRLTPVMIVLALTLTAVVLGLALTWLILRRLHSPRLERWLHRFPKIESFWQGLREVPAEVLRDGRLLMVLIVLHIAVFVLDAATVGAILQAFGGRADVSLVFASYIMSEAAAALGFFTGGVGTFEAMCVLMLHASGVPSATALAVALVMNGFSIWLPLLPGMWIARREVARHSEAAA